MSALIAADELAAALAAARAWWLLGYHGHADVRVLDGGYDGWVARGLEVTTEVPEPEPGDFQAHPGQRPLLDADAAGNLAPDGRLRPAEELRARFAALGVRQGAPVGAYCGSGVVAASEVLALEVAGFDAALYAGSWSEWITTSAARA